MVTGSTSDAALGQQFLDVPVRMAVPQVPPDREQDHPKREPEASRDGGRAKFSHQITLPPSATGQRNSADNTKSLGLLMRLDRDWE